MFQAKSFATKSVMSTLVVSNMVTALAGNGSVLAILTRFKRLRTFPNILLANLALVNLLCPLINMPIFLSEDVLEADQFEDKNSSPLVISSMQFGFIILNLASTVTLMLDRFLAVYIELRYHTWKTRKKAFLIAALIWFSCSLLVAFTIIPALGIDQAHGSLEEYQWLIYEKRRPYITSAMVFFILFAVGVGLMTIYAIHHKKKQVNVVLHIYFSFRFFGLFVCLIFVYAFI